MTNMREKAMLVQLSMCRWGATKTDRILSKRVEKSQDAASGTVTAVKRLMPEFNASFHRINNITRFARQEHNAMTLPSLYRNEGVLTGKVFVRYMTVLSGLEAEFYSSVNAFCEVYPEIKRQAPERMGKMYKASDFPEINRIAGFYSFSVKRRPIPATDDWRIDNIGDDAIEDIKKEIALDMEILYNNCHMEVCNRMAVILKRLTNQLQTYKAGPGSGAGLQQPLFDDLKEFTEVIPLLNIGDDPVINRIVDSIKSDVLSLEPTDIRGNDELRKQIATLTSDMLSKVS